METVLIETPTHGRVLIEDAAGSASGRMLVGFHGYGQSAETMLDEMRRIPGAEAWRLVSAQALHRFYARGNQAVVASWMTRQDREAAVADNIEYVNRAVAAAGGDEFGTIVFLGFSQGAAMAARAATRGQPRAAGLILLAGDIPPDVKDDPAVRFPPTLVGVGTRETWYTPDKVDADLACLRARGTTPDVVRFDGGHEFTDESRAAVGRWLRTSASARASADKREPGNPT